MPYPPGKPRILPIVGSFGDSTFDFKVVFHHEPSLWKHFMIEQIIEPRDALISGELKVKRVLPFRSRRSVGPFVFLDHMGPFDLSPGKSGDVPPHPHIGLSTVTYLFEGELTHRDSLGTVQQILPGDVNWMTAGQGIVHSERAPEKLRNTKGHLHGLQAWVALPREREECDPSFKHHNRQELPSFTKEGVQVTVIAGTAFGFESPVRTDSKLFYLDLNILKGCQFEYDSTAQEAAFYLIRGEAQIDGMVLSGPTLVVFKPGIPLKIEAQENSHGMLLGGAPLDGPRHIWWNFVSSSKERIEKAKADWREQTFPKIPGETDFVPLPK